MIRAMIRLNVREPFTVIRLRARAANRLQREIARMGGIRLISVAIVIRVLVSDVATARRVAIIALTIENVVRLRLRQIALRITRRFTVNVVGGEHNRTLYVRIISGLDYLNVALSNLFIIARVNFVVMRMRAFKARAMSNSREVIGLRALRGLNVSKLPIIIRNFRRTKVRFNGRVLIINRDGIRVRRRFTFFGRLINVRISFPALIIRIARILMNVDVVAKSTKRTRILRRRILNHLTVRISVNHGTIIPRTRIRARIRNILSFHDRNVSFRAIRVRAKITRVVVTLTMYSGVNGISSKLIANRAPAQASEGRKRPFTNFLRPEFISGIPASKRYKARCPAFTKARLNHAIRANERICGVSFLVNVVNERNVVRASPVVVNTKRAQVSATNAQ